MLRKFVLPALLFIACSKPAEHGLQLEVPCSYDTLSVLQGTEFPLIVMSNVTSSKLIVSSDSLIEVSFLEPDRITVYEKSFYRRINGKAHTRIDSFYDPGMEEISLYTNINWGQDSVILYTREKVNNSWSSLDRSFYTIFYLDGMGNPYRMRQYGSRVNELIVDYTFGEDSAQGIVFPEWQWLGLPAPFLATEEVSNSGSKVTYSYNFDQQSRLLSYEKSQFLIPEKRQGLRQCHYIKYP